MANIFTRAIDGLEKIHREREAEANEEVHVTWQEKAAIGKTARQANNPNWREDGEVAWAKGPRAWLDWWTNYIKTGQ